MRRTIAATFVVVGTVVGAVGGAILLNLDDLCEVDCGQVTWLDVLFAVVPAGGVLMVLAGLVVAWAPWRRRGY